MTVHAAWLNTGNIRVSNYEMKWGLHQEIRHIRGYNGMLVMDGGGGGSCFSWLCTEGNIQVETFFTYPRSLGDIFYKPYKDMHNNLILCVAHLGILLLCKWMYIPREDECSKTFCDASKFRALLSRVLRSTVKILRPREREQVLGGGGGE